MTKLNLLALVILLASCEPDEKELIHKINIADLNITIGNICGWCTGMDSLTFTHEITTYNFRKCSEVIEDKTQNTNVTQWNEIIQLLEIEEFRSINYNECGVCYDGCDTWISLSDSSFHHQIRWVRIDTVILEPILPLILKLDSIRQVYREAAGN